MDGGSFACVRVLCDKVKYICITFAHSGHVMHTVRIESDDRFFERTLEKPELCCINVVKCAPFLRSRGCVWNGKAN